jgi:hypothetical protein
MQCDSKLIPKKIYFSQSQLVKKFVDINFSNNLRNKKIVPIIKKRLVIKLNQIEPPEIIKPTPQKNQEVTFKKADYFEVKEEVEQPMSLFASPSMNTGLNSKKAEMQQNLNFLLKSLNRHTFSDTMFPMSCPETQRETKNSMLINSSTKNYNNQNKTNYNLKQKREYFERKVVYLTKTIWGESNYDKKDELRLPSIKHRLEFASSNNFKMKN